MVVCCTVHSFHPAIVLYVHCTLYVNVLLQYGPRLETGRDASMDGQEVDGRRETSPVASFDTCLSVSVCHNPATGSKCTIFAPVASRQIQETENFIQHTRVVMRRILDRHQTVLCTITVRCSVKDSVAVGRYSFKSVFMAVLYPASRILIYIFIHCIYILIHLF